MRRLTWPNTTTNTCPADRASDLRRHRVSLRVGLVERRAPRVVDVFQTFRDVKLRDHLVTTNHVVTETITLTRKIGHEKATRLGEQLYGEKIASIHWTTPDEEREAFEYFKRHSDQAYSLVDCLSFVVMEKFGIREALAVDSDFTHRFVARPRARPI